MSDSPIQWHEEAARDEIRHPHASIVGAISSLGLQPGMRVLDTGCGAGPHLALFADRVAPSGVVVGVDRDDEALGIAAGLHADRIVDGLIQVVPADLHRLPSDNGTFDIAWMSAVLHHVEEPASALVEMGRVLRPGGQVAVMDGDGDGSFPCLPWDPELEHVLRAAALRAQRDGFGGTLPYAFDGYVGRKLPQLLIDAGFVEVRLRAYAHADSHPMRPRSEAALCRWFLESFGPRVRDYLAPRDWDRLTAAFTPTSPGYLPSRPGFFVARTSFLATGVVP